MKNRIIIVIILFGIVGTLFWFLATKRVDPFEDKNSNGVRDDVEAKILEKYGHSQNMTNGLFQMARALQKASSEYNMTKERAYEISREADRALACLEYIDYNFIDNDTEGWVVNSYKRARIYNHYNAQFSGTMLEKIPDGNTCDFRVEK